LKTGALLFELLTAFVQRVDIDIGVSVSVGDLVGDLVDFEIQIEDFALDLFVKNNVHVDFLCSRLAVGWTSRNQSLAADRSAGLFFASGSVVSIALGDHALDVGSKFAAAPTVYILADLDWLRIAAVLYAAPQRCFMDWTRATQKTTGGLLV
jgi:hypothetical protein